MQECSTLEGRVDFQGAVSHPSSRVFSQKHFGRKQTLSESFSPCWVVTTALMETDTAVLSTEHELRHRKPAGPSHHLPSPPPPKIWWGTGQYPSELSVSLPRVRQETPGTPTQRKRLRPHAKIGTHLTRRQSSSLCIQGSRSSNHRSAPTTQQTRT